MTGVVNRRAIATGAAVLVLAGFVPAVSLVFASLPEAVLGGCTVMMFGNIIVSGFQMIANAGFSQRNITIAALSLAVGIGFTQMGDIFTVLPELLQSVFARQLRGRDVCGGHCRELAASQRRAGGRAARDAQ